MNVVAHDIDGLGIIIKSGLFNNNLAFKFKVVDVTWSRSSKVLQMQLKSSVDDQLIEFINSDFIVCDRIQNLHNKYGFGCTTDELLAIAYCAENKLTLLTDDKSISKISYNEGIKTCSYNEILDYVLDINLDNEKIIEIKKSGRRPT